MAMRFIALEAGMAPGFSSGGSLEVILFRAMIGVPVALLVWICRAKWRLPFWFGTIAGVALFVILSVFQPPAARSALAGTPDKAWWTTVLFAAVFVFYGAVIDAIWTWRKSRPALER
jgi:zinc transporter ZupT